MKPRFCSPFNTTTSNLHLEHTKGQNVYINKNVSMHLCRQILFEAYTNNEKQLANKSLHIAKEAVTYLQLADPGNDEALAGTLVLHPVTASRFLKSRGTTGVSLSGQI